MSSTIPEYPEGHALLAGKSVLVTAAAGTGIGFATARRCAEEGARVMLSDIHERRLGEAVDELEKLVGVRPASRLCNVTDEVQVGGLIEAAENAEEPAAPYARRERTGICGTLRSP